MTPCDAAPWLCLSMFMLLQRGWMFTCLHHISQQSFQLLLSHFCGRKADRQLSDILVTVNEVETAGSLETIGVVVAVV